MLAALACLSGHEKKGAKRERVRGGGKRGREGESRGDMLRHRHRHRGESECKSKRERKGGTKNRRGQWGSERERDLREVPRTKV